MFLNSRRITVHDMVSKSLIVILLFDFTDLNTTNIRSPVLSVIPLSYSFYLWYKLPLFPIPQFFSFPLLSLQLSILQLFSQRNFTTSVSVETKLWILKNLVLRHNWIQEQTVHLDTQRDFHLQKNWQVTSMYPHVSQ